MAAAGSGRRDSSMCHDRRNADAASSLHLHAGTRHYHDALRSSTLQYCAETVSAQNAPLGAHCCSGDMRSSELVQALASQALRSSLLQCLWPNRSDRLRHCLT